MIMEFRTYTMRPGARAEFVAFFESEAIPRMRAAGMTVLGQFSSVTDDTVFAYARTFASLAERERQYEAFYGSEDWLGWMIDTALGKEESFIVFLGDSRPQSPSEPAAEPVPAVLSGVHSDRFTLASVRGRTTAVTAGSISVDGDDGVPVSFTLPEDVRVYSTPHGRGTSPAVAITMGDIQPGDQVLVLGADTQAGPVARQIVKRPPLVAE